MAQSYFNETIINGKQCFLNHIRTRKINDKVILTTDHGAWVALTKEEHTQLIKKEMDDSLYKLLEEKGIIVTNQNLDMIISDFKKRNDFLFNGTNLHIMLPTLRCNHKCIYCHSSAKQKNDTKYDMTQETAKKTLEFIFQTPAKSITIEFQGGDALLNTGIFKYVVKEAKKMNDIYKKNLRLALVTNLTLMDHEITEFIEQEGVGICTSLDGPKEVHDKNRVYEGNKPTYDDVVKWINKLDKEYKKSVGALMVTTRHSLPYWKEIVDEYVKWGLGSLQIKYINKLGFAEHEWEQIGYTMDEFLEFWKKSVDYMIELNKKGVNIQERFVKLILQKILSKQDPSFLDFRSPCGIVIGQLAYDYNGDIYSCDEGRNFDLFKLGNVKNNSYKEILTQDKSQELISASINDNYLCDNCAYKPYCGVCPVINYAETGNIVPMLATNSKCKYHKFMFDYVFEKLLFDSEVREIFFSWVNNPKRNEHEHCECD